MENNKIVAVRVYLDDNVPEDMLGVDRLSNIEIEYEDGTNEVNGKYCNYELNDENKSSEEEAREFVAQQLDVDMDIVEVIE